jgi:hypothetical protein
MASGKCRHAGRLTPPAFIAKWTGVALSERAASQEHFIDLCRMLGQPTPAEHDSTGTEYTFEKGVTVTAAASAGSQGDRGFADVWWRGRFGWEYKRQGVHRDLAHAYRQLCQYREALENPPLLVVCDIDRIQVHTNFTRTRPVPLMRVPLLCEQCLSRPDSILALSPIRAYSNPPRAA